MSAALQRAMQNRQPRALQSDHVRSLHDESESGLRVVAYALVAAVVVWGALVVAFA